MCYCGMYSLLSNVVFYTLLPTITTVPHLSNNPLVFYSHIYSFYLFERINCSIIYFVVQGDKICTGPLFVNNLWSNKFQIF